MKYLLFTDTILQDVEHLVSTSDYLQSSSSYLLVAPPDFISLFKSSPLAALPFHVISPDEFSDEPLSKYNLIVLSVADHQYRDFFPLLHDYDGFVVCPKFHNAPISHPLFFTSIPKSGTHLVTKLLQQLNIPYSTTLNSEPSCWNTILDFKYHAPYDSVFSNEFSEPTSRLPFNLSPIIFVYRHPWDVVLSMASWFTRPENSFSNCFSCPSNIETSTIELLSKDILPGGLLAFFRSYQSWFHMHNVIPISFEDLVGSPGGGSESRQNSVIWSLILKLQVSASTTNVGSNLYDISSPTFTRGKIGHFLDKPSDILSAFRHHLPLSSLPEYGYQDNTPYSSVSSSYSKRPLRLNTIEPSHYYNPRLIRSNSLANIVEAAGRYFILDHMSGPIDTISIPLFKLLISLHLGFPSLDRASEALASSSSSDFFAEGVCHLLYSDAASLTKLYQINRFLFVIINNSDLFHNNYLSSKAGITISPQAFSRSHSLLVL